ncbi:MAG: hypothetical protein R2847_09060 [Bacteroidia bacterium]
MRVIWGCKQEMLSQEEFSIIESAIRKYFSFNFTFYHDGIEKFYGQIRRTLQGNEIFIA